ncbi:MAG: GNAT family N-acetyltransferase [Gammaproteobacteria bacterium]|nr:GNAT family N-acetyltransferase [Gammaproteobacteria bacterium]
MKICSGWQPGLIGEVVGRHGQYYASAWGFTHFFEAKVAQDMGRFVQRYSAQHDLLLSAWDDDLAFRASISIDGSDPDLARSTAHLRWFISSAERSGAGRVLLNKAMDFLVERAYQSCYLTTFRGLDAARALYESVGFNLVDEGEDETWGTPVVEQRFEWRRG